LEVGCGAGFSAPYLMGMYESFVGVDYSKELIDCANQIHCSDNTQFYCENIKTFEIDRKFDVVFMIGFLHHVDDLKATLTHMKKFVKPGGWLVANEPQHSNFVIRLARKIRKKIDGAYSSEQVELSANDLRSAFEETGFGDTKVLPQGIFSTPFAEVIMPLQFITSILSYLACKLDTMLEIVFPRTLKFFSWNLVVAGRITPVEEKR